MLLTEIFYDNKDNYKIKDNEIEDTESSSVMDASNETRSGVKKEIFNPINGHNPIAVIKNRNRNDATTIFSF